MKNSMFSKVFGRHILAAGALVLAASLSSPGSVAAQISTFTVSNESSYQITHLYVSPSVERRWGLDKLGSYVLFPNYYVNMTLAPGRYDVMLVDQDRDSCILTHVDLRNGERWTITDDVLLACEWLSER